MKRYLQVGAVRYLLISDGGRHVVLELIPHQLPVHPPGGISYSGNPGLHGRSFGDQLVRPDKKKFCKGIHL